MALAAPAEGRELLIHNSSVVSPGMGLLGPGHTFTLKQVTETKAMKSVDWPELGYMLTFWFWYYRGLTSPKPRGLGKAG